MRSRLSSRLSICAWVGLALSILTAEICDAQRPDAKGLALLATAQPIAAAPDAGPLVGKLIERFNVSVEAYQHVYSKYKRGYTGIDPVFETGKRLFDARMELATERNEQIQDRRR